MKSFPHFELQATSIQTSFDGFNSVFPETSLKLSNGDIVGITGMNGSGKSTLIKILAGVLSARQGNIQMHIDNELINKESFPMHIGLVAPYLELYEEFTPLEHMGIFAR